ncbi:hypothetical protein [Actinoplanes subglobosus]|uniref:Uncharacterized protein n=1 Tax=Actinoplanes subglobosus TaxID=1547892 RepID=A0ABV8J1I7_9ACTN
MKGWGLLVFGAGVGALGGALTGRVSIPVAIGGVVAGLILIMLGSRPRTGSLIDDARSPATATRVGAGPSPRKADRPTLAGLGNRVEDILRLAEEQAADHRAEAKRDADAIIAAAHAEAQRINPQ